MAFKQPRVPEYRGGNDFLRMLVLWLKDFANDVWTATRMTDKELAGIQSPVTSVNEKTGAVELGAADVGARPDTWTPTARDVGALGKSETAADAAKLGGKAAAYYLQPRNLLDNSDFTRPVNQRGQSSYGINGGYTIDRWFLEGSACWVTDNFVSIGSGSTLVQRVPKGMMDASKLYTLAVKDRSGNIRLNENAGLVLMDDSGSHGFHTIKINAGEHVWAALYEGEYTADTLPPYGPKGYAAELVECLRYYRTITVGGVGKGSYAGGDFPFFPPMRVEHPTISPAINSVSTTTGEAAIRGGGVTASRQDVRVDILVDKNDFNWWHTVVTLSADL